MNSNKHIKGESLAESLVKTYRSLTPCKNLTQPTKKSLLRPVGNNSPLPKYRSSLSFSIPNKEDYSYRTVNFFSTLHVRHGVPPNFGAGFGSASRPFNKKTVEKVETMIRDKQLVVPQMTRTTRSWDSRIQQNAPSLSRPSESFFRGPQKSLTQTALTRHQPQPEPQNPSPISNLDATSPNASPIPHKYLQNQNKIRRHARHKIANDPVTALTMDQNCLKLQNNFQFQNLVVLQKPNIIAKVFVNDNKFLTKTLWGKESPPQLNCKIISEHAFFFFRQNEILPQNLQNLVVSQESHNSPCESPGLFQVRNQGNFRAMCNF